MAKNTSKKLFAGLLALSAGFILASCDPISAVPTNYNNPIVSSEDGAVNVDDNKIGAIYDAVSSEKNAKVVEGILREIAEKKFGSWEEFYKVSNGSITVEKFTKDHKDYFGTGSKAAKRFEQFKKDVEERISEYFYNEITNSSYENELGQFSEEKFYNAKRYDLYDLDKIEYADEAEQATKFSTFFVDKEVTKAEAFGKLTQKAQYQKTTSRGYIKEKVFPDILKDKLVEDYVYRENRNSLGRAYARNVNMIKLTYEGKKPFARDLASAFATEHIEVHPTTTEKPVDFEILVNAYKGFKPSPSTDSTKLIDRINDKVGEEDAEELLYKKLTLETRVEVKAADAAHYKYLNFVLVPTGTYPVETKLGQILKDYQLAIAGEDAGRFPSPEQKTALESFTGEGKSKEYGLFQKILSLMKEDYTTDGWHVKSGGISDLPTDLKDRLFNIRVANSIDDVKALVNEVYNVDDEVSTIGKWMYEAKADGSPDTNKPLTRLPYLRKISGHKFVIPQKPSYKVKPQNYVYDDVSGKAVVICEVLEAPSTAKLNPDSTTVYDNDPTNPLKKEGLARQIAKVLGTKDSYIKDAYTEVLNKYEFAFYDSSLYDYLKEQYPDLDIFDED